MDQSKRRVGRAAQDLLGDLIVSGDRIKVYGVCNPAAIPWGSHGVDVVLECTVLFASKAKASAHIAGGAKKVIISSPGDKVAKDRKLSSGALVIVRIDESYALLPCAAALTSSHPVQAVAP